MRMIQICVANHKHLTEYKKNYNNL